MDRIETGVHFMVVEVVKSGEEYGEGIVRVAGSAAWFFEMDDREVQVSLIPTGLRIGDGPQQWDESGAGAIVRMSRDAPVGEFFDRLRAGGEGVIHELFFGRSDGL